MLITQYIGRLQKGFTLVELMVVIAILAILTAVAVPSFQSVIVGNAVNSAAAELQSDLNFARSEAVKRGVSVTACVSTSTTACSDSDDWKQGWIVFIDRDANNSRSGTASNNEDLLRVKQEIAGAFSINSATGTVKTVRFERTGTASGRAIKVAPSNTAFSVGRAVCVSTTGRVRVTNPGTEDCNGLL